MPLQPSIAQVRCGHRPANRSMAAAPSRSVAKRPRSSTVSSAAITSTVTDRLCGSIPMTTRSGRLLIPVLRCSILHLVVEPGGHRYFEPSKPLLSLSPPLATPGTAQAK